MKNALIILFLVVSNSLLAQKYAAVIPLELPDSAGCGGKAKLEIIGFTAPLEISWWDDVWQPSSSFHAQDLCDNGRYTVDNLDSNCNSMNVFMTMHYDPSLQVSFDTVIMIMPSAPGMCDGEFHFQFNNILPIHEVSFYSSDTVIIGQNYSFTNMCEGKYRYNVVLASTSSGEYSVVVDNRYPTVNPLCATYQSDLDFDFPTTPTSCNGELTINASSVIDSLYYYYYVYAFNPGIIQGDTTFHYQNVCEGPYLVDVEAWNGGFQMVRRQQFYIPSYASLGTSWNAPDSLLPNTDTLLLEAVYDCSANFLQGIDTAYISSIAGIGNGQFEFGITMVQDTNVYTAYGTAIADTSLNFFIDITIFCEDPSRNVGDYFNKRNLIYHGDILQNINGISLFENIHSLKVYPNPSEKVFQIDFESKETSMLNFELTDITGKLISSFNFSSSIGKNHLNLDLEQLNSGLYLLNIRNEKGLLKSKKLIKD